MSATRLRSQAARAGQWLAGRPVAGGPPSSSAGPVKSRVAEKQDEGREWTIFLILSLLIVPFLIGFARILHEEFFNGIGTFRLHVSTE